MPATKKENKISNVRPPVVVVLGHVDHGKSSLLEAIKDFNITAKESGGITQHVGAYEVEHKGKKITFIDTPGHEAFSAIRARGASVADIAILVVDSADEVQPQTKEAINVIKRAEIPMIVVLNKIDKATSDPEKIKRDLSKFDVFVESMGGQVPSVKVSAKTKQGIDELLEVILLVADMGELKADFSAKAEAVVIESYMDQFKGPVATLIVTNGTLHKKDIIGTHSTVAKVKGLEDYQHKPIEQALPSQPVIVLGFEQAPGVGEKVKTYASYDEAQKNLTKKEKEREVLSTVINPESGQKVLNIILKADVMGSLEALETVLKSLPQDKIILRILKGEAGDINESDVKLAEMSKAQIVGFRVKINPAVLEGLKRDRDKKVKIKTFDIIYDLIQEVRQMMEKSMELEIIRQDFGKVKALVIFWGEKNRQIVGGKVIEGEIKKGLKIEVFRDEKKVGEGRIINLQRNKKDMEKLSKGDECGIMFEGNVKVQEKDILAFYGEEKKRGEL
jgi:translation initiation factor IF-2